MTVYLILRQERFERQGGEYCEDAWVIDHITTDEVMARICAQDDDHRVLLATEPFREEGA